MRPQDGGQVFRCTRRRAKGRCGGAGLLRDGDGHKVTAKQQPGERRKTEGKGPRRGQIKQKERKMRQRGEGKASTVMLVQRALEKGMEEDKVGGGGGR